MRGTTMSVGEMTIEEATLLRDAGYRATWVENISVGDDIALKSYAFRLPGDHEQQQRRLTVTNVKRSRDGVVSFIAQTSEGVESHHSYGALYPVWIKE
jgi:2-hydroxychromene-2-carboxylate isomerase